MTLTNYKKILIIDLIYIVNSTVNIVVCKCNWNLKIYINKFSNLE